MTVDVDILLTGAGLEAFKRAHLGRGYLEKFPGSRGMPDTEHGVDIDVVLAGEYPGNRKPKPVAFPDPATAGVEGPRLRLLPLHKLVELRLASAMSAPHGLRDMADVLEVIRLPRLPEDFAVQLDPSVRDKRRRIVDEARGSRRPCLSGGVRPGNITVMALARKKATTIALDPHVDRLLTRAAREHGVSRAEFLRRQLDLVLEQYRSHPRPRSAGVIRRPLPERGDEAELFRDRRR